MCNRQKPFFRFIIFRFLLLLYESTAQVKYIYFHMSYIQLMKSGCEWSNIKSENAHRCIRTLTVCNYTYVFRNYKTLYLTWKLKFRTRIPISAHNLKMYMIMFDI